MLAQAQYLLIKANLLANVRHKLLVLNVPLLEEALVVLDFQVEVTVDLLEVAAAEQSLDKFCSVPYDCVLLLEDGRLVESPGEAIQLLNNHLQLLVGYKLLSILHYIEPIRRQLPIATHFIHCLQQLILVLLGLCVDALAHE